jgi:hypothetical protein
MSPAALSGSAAAGAAWEGPDATTRYAQDLERRVPFQPRAPGGRDAVLRHSEPALGHVGLPASSLPPPRIALAWATEPAPGPPHRPFAVAVDGDGRVYALEAGTHSLAQLDPDGRLLARWGGAGNEVGQFRFRRSPTNCDDDALPVTSSTDARSPSWGERAVGGGVAVDREGRVYVADYGNHRVQGFDGTGRFLGGLGAGGEWPG